MRNTVFENTTVYNTELISALSDLSGLAIRKQTHSIRKIAMLICAVICILISALCFIAFSQQTLGICLALVGILAGVKGIMFQRFKIWGGAPAGKEEVRTFSFMDEGIRMTRSNGSQKGCLYGDIMLHSETEQFFLLMHNFQTGFLIRKDGFSQGSIDDFREFLIKKTFCRQFELVNEPINK